MNEGIRHKTETPSQCRSILNLVPEDFYRSVHDIGLEEVGVFDRKSISMNEAFIGEGMIHKTEAPCQSP